MTDEYLTTKDVAKMLKISLITVYRLAEKGQIPCYRIGGLWRFKESEIEEWAKWNK